jgi:uncharacterized membrane protein SirB2
MFPTLKAIHVASVALSIAGFLVRGILVWREAPVMRRRWVRVVPHINDTVLLASAVAMAVLSAQYPFVAGWLTAKVFGLVAYVALGAVALRSASRERRRAAFVAALLVFGWIVSVALTRHPAGVFSLAGG